MKKLAELTWRINKNIKFDTSFYLEDTDQETFDEILEGAFLLGDLMQGKPGTGLRKPMGDFMYSAIAVYQSDKYKSDGGIVIRTDRFESPAYRTDVYVVSENSELLNMLQKLSSSMSNRIAEPKIDINIDAEAWYRYITDELKRNYSLVNTRVKEDIIESYEDRIVKMSDIEATHNRPFFLPTYSEIDWIQAFNKESIYMVIPSEDVIYSINDLIKNSNVILVNHELKGNIVSRNNIRVTAVQRFAIIAIKDNKEVYYACITPSRGVTYNGLHDKSVYRQYRINNSSELKSVIRNTVPWASSFNAIDDNNVKSAEINSYIEQIRNIVGDSFS